MLPGPEDDRISMSGYVSYIGVRHRFRKNEESMSQFMDHGDVYRY